jgi:hypothetical protein
MKRKPSKIDSNRGKIVVVADLAKRWPSIRIKNDSRITEHRQDCSSSDSERRFGKEKVVCTFCSHSLPPEQREDRVTYYQDLIAVADADKNFPLTPNGYYSGRTAPLTTRRCILNIYSTNIRTEYFKHAA